MSLFLFFWVKNKRLKFHEPSTVLTDSIIKMCTFLTMMTFLGGGEAMHLGDPGQLHKKKTVTNPANSRSIADIMLECHEIDLF